MPESAHIRMLLVDDDDLFCMAIADLLAELPVEIVRVASLAQAREMVSSSFDVVVLDDQLPDGRGLDLLDMLRVLTVQPLVIVVSGAPDIEMAIAALRYRALDFLYKPIEPSSLVRLVRSARPAKPPPITLDHSQLNPQHLRYAASDASLLLRGETGTGKTSLARQLHAASHRRNGPFVVVNCGALPEALIESELFGSEHGAFTGAGKARAGLIESAAGGTFVLDEIGDLPLGCQAKLLDVLETKTVRRIGAVNSRHVDVRFMAATHVDLEAAAEAGRFRRDLLFRLDVVRIELPALRAQPERLPGLISELLQTLQITRPLAQGELERLSAYAWPGNIRELRNTLARTAMAQPEGTLSPSALLPQSIEPRSDAVTPTQEPATVEEIALRHMAEVAANSPTRKHAAAVLGIGESTLRRKLKQAEQSGRFERSLQRSAQFERS